ncbi:MAG: helix-turn-helix domain-containing protein, partial [Chloroflexota bacterium]|nr:helix-turn-helix domain-containing protein [Chloroflexota bacterium]
MTAQTEGERVLKISEFSGLGRVTIKALRLYDRLGLLKPVWVDPDSGYRFYTLDQLPRLNRILALKDLGFSLGEIRGQLDEDPSPAELRGMLRLKRAELERQVAEGRERLAWVEARLRQIEREGMPPVYDVALKSVPSLMVASARSVEPTHESFIRFTYEVPALVEDSGVRAPVPRAVSSTTRASGNTTPMSRWSSRSRAVPSWISPLPKADVCGCASWR